MLALGGCDDGMATLSGSNRDSRVLSLMADVRQPDPTGLFVGGVDYESSDDRLQAAALVHLRGKSQAEALGALSEDGFACRGQTCTTTVSERETWIVRYGIRQPGPLREFTRLYAVSVLGERVERMADLEASVTSEVRDADA